METNSTSPQTIKVDSSAATSLPAPTLNREQKRAAQKAKNKQLKTLKLRGLKAKPGFRDNRLKHFPRNNPCFCGSGRKFKQCCVKIVMPILPEEAAKRIDQIWNELVAGTAIIKGKPQEGPDAKGTERS